MRDYAARLLDQILRARLAFLISGGTGAGKTTLLAALLGGAAAFACLLVPMRLWQTLSPLMFLIGLALLCLVLVPGMGFEVNGARRWVRLGVMNLQVSEPARLCLLIYLAGYVVRKQKTLRGTSGYGEVRWDAEVTNQDDEIVAQYDVLTMVATDAHWQSVN